LSISAAETGLAIFADANQIAPNKFAFRKLRRFMSVSSCLLPYCPLLAWVIRVFHFYYVTHPITNDAAIQPHRSEYLRSLPPFFAYLIFVHPNLLADRDQFW
jgi:hypothetical protein